MRMIISGRHLKVTDAIREYAEKKIGRIQKYFENIMEVDITLSAEHSKVDGERHTADVLLFVQGSKIKASATAQILYAAIDEVIDILENQVKKHKEKMKDKQHQSVRELEAEKVNLSSDEDKEKKIVKSKIVSPRPMSVDEAILQMEALEQDFYSFMNHETEQLNIVYKRKDGDYGHVEPGWAK
jgi:putative sigma-54 modulation protein